MEQGPNDPKLPATPAKPEAATTSSSTGAAPGQAEAEAAQKYAEEKMTAEREVYNDVRYNGVPRARIGCSRC